MPAYARVAEVLDPETLEWTKLSTAKLEQAWYGFNFVTTHPTNGKTRIFTAGPKEKVFSIYPNDTSPTWSELTGQTATPLIGGSAVQYEINKIMKSGTRDSPADNVNATNRTQTIDLSVSSPVWTERSAMSVGRVNENLTLLPTGDVLCLGGTQSVNNASATGPVKKPELWSPSTLTWSGYGTLDSSSFIRDYHNTALLMPDGRVMAGGGNLCSSHLDCHDNDRYADLFSPPYLFTTGDAIATRPRIIGVHGRLAYDDTFSVVTDVSITSTDVVLMRAGAVTHGFDQEQRIVRPTYVSTPSASPPRHVFQIQSDHNVLPPGHYQLFVLKNGVPSISRWLHIGDPPNSYDIGDRIPPKKVGLSLVSSCIEDFTIRWNAPADDSSMIGVASQYDLRYTTSNNFCDTCWTNFKNASQVDDEPTPAAYGVQQEISPTGIVTGVPLKFSMVSSDDRNTRTSAMSASLSVTLHYCDGLYGGGGGGGGGSSARTSDAFSLAPGAEEGEAFTENSLLDSTEPGVSGTDRVPLDSGPEAVNGRLRVRLRQGGASSSHLERVRLVALDHTGEVAAFAGSDARAGSFYAAEEVRSASGTSLLERLTGDDAPMIVAPGETLLVTLPADGSTGTGSLLVRTSGASAASGGSSDGIEVQTPTSGGAWITLSHLTPRDGLADHVVDGITGRTVRLVMLGRHAISRLGRLVPAAETPQQTALTPVALQHSRLGTLPVSDLSELGAGITLSARDSLSIEFDALAPQAGRTRSWALEVQGSRERSRSANEAHRGGVREPMPHGVVLLQNRPNPFSSGSTFFFGLPTETVVRLEVFDLQGRRRAMLAQGRYSAGLHSIEWHRVDDNGGTVPPGMYLYRLTAGSAVVERKLTVFP